MNDSWERSKDPTLLLLPVPSGKGTKVESTGSGLDSADMWQGWFYQTPPASHKDYLMAKTSYLMTWAAESQNDTRGQEPPTHIKTHGLNFKGDFLPSFHFHLG